MSTGSIWINGLKSTFKLYFSASLKYGIRAMIFLAQQPKDEYVHIRKISTDLNISFHFLTKIFQSLSEARLVVSSKGARGGVKLTKEAVDINILEIHNAIDGDDLFTQCTLGLALCSDQRACPLHDNWKKIRESLEDFLRRSDLKNLNEEILEKNFWIKNQF